MWWDWVMSVGEATFPPALAAAAVALLAWLRDRRLQEARAHEHDAGAEEKEASAAEKSMDIASKALTMQEQMYKRKLAEHESRITHLEESLAACQNERHTLMQWATTLIETWGMEGARPISYDDFKQQNGFT